MATMQAEIEEIDRQRRLLVRQQQRHAKHTELEHVLRGTRQMQAAPPTSCPPQGASHHPATSTSGLFAGSFDPIITTNHDVSGTQSSEQPPAYSISQRAIPGGPEPASETAQSLGEAQPHSSATLDSPPPLSSRHLPKPIAIPATSNAFGSPFLRAYPPWLAGYGVDRAAFLGFLDDLNRCAVISPPLRVLELAGNVVSFVPLLTAQIVGSSVQAAALLAMYGVSKGRMELCLRAANREVFAPRGLKVEIARLATVARAAEMPIWDAATGRVDKRAPVLAPLDGLSRDGLQLLSPHQRRLDALGAWIAPLDLAPLPDIKRSNNILGRVNAFASERQRKKEEKKMLKGRKKAYKNYEKDSRGAVEDFEKQMRKLEREETKVRRRASVKKLRKGLAKIEKERGKVVREKEKETAKAEKHKIRDDKEQKRVRRILWVLIRNIEDPSGPGPNPFLEFSEGNTSAHTD